MRHIKIFEDYNVIKDIELFLQDKVEEYGHDVRYKKII